MKLRWKDLKKEAKKAEWRGTLLCREIKKHLWEVRQDWVDPVRLYIPQLDLEFAYGFMHSDGPSIPTLVCMLFGKSREDLIKSGFTHDYGYEHAILFVRRPNEEWGTVTLDKESIDTILRIGCLAEGAADWQADLIYWGVRTKIGEKAWKKCRRQDKDNLQDSAESV